MPVLRLEDAPEFSWENVCIGDVLGRVEGSIGEDVVRAHAFAINDDPERYLSDETKSFVPPTLLSNELLKMFFLGYTFGPLVRAGLHTRSQIQYFEPVRIDEPVVLTGTHVAKYVKDGRRYRCQAGEVSRPDGSTLVRMLATETFGYDIHDESDYGDAPSDWSADLPKVPLIPPTDTRVFGSREERVSYEQSILFSGLPFVWAYETPAPVRQGTHTNSIAAREAGFQKPIVQGLLTASRLTKLLLDEFGSHSVFGAQLSFTFISPLLVAENFSVFGMKSERDPSKHVELVAKNGAGDALAVGHARNLT